MKVITNKYSELLHPQTDFKSFAELQQQEKEVEVTLGRFCTGDKTNLLTNKYCAIFLACCLRQTKTVLVTKPLISLLLCLHRDYETSWLGLSLTLQNIYKACKLDRPPNKNPTKKTCLQSATPKLQCLVHKKWKLQIKLKFINHHYLNHCSVSIIFLFKKPNGFIRG